MKSGGKMSMTMNGEMGEETKQKFRAFPYKPYSIQIDFMNALYDSLDKGGIAMLESPTGTGKTLSIICSALQWLVDRKQRQNNDSLVDLVDMHSNRKNGDCVGSDEEPDWLRNSFGSKEVESPKKKVKVKKRLGFSSKKRDETEIEESFRDLYSQFREIEVDLEHNVIVRGEGERLDDKEFLVDEYESGDEKNGLCKRKGGGVCCGSSSSDDDNEDKGFSDDEEEETDFKIYFCSRTHSQLSQFVKELRKTDFGNELKVACLGSRKNFCINEEVMKLGNSTLINERCLDLQKNKKSQVSKKKNSGVDGRKRQTKSSSGCPMLSKRKLQKQFKTEMTEKGPLDIEDLVRLGGNLGTCPYYGSRSMVHAADLVVLPYQSLLSKSSRESLGLSLKNSVVIIDEAHNLADSLISMYDSKVTLSQLELVNSSLEGYFQRFQNLLGPGNRRHIQTLMVLTRAFIQTLCNTDDANFINSSGSECSLCINEFVFSLNIDNINLVKLLLYIKDSNMIHKVSGYGDKIISLQNDTTSVLSAFRALAGILLSLTNHDSDGRIIISRKKPTESGQQGGYLKYVMLTGEKIFHEIVNEAHAVVLAGGTLQPIEETRMRLFPWLAQDQLHFFSCGHIISSDNILPISVSTGPTGQPFDFSYSCRSTSAMVGELGLLLCNLVTAVPQGIIVFFSSFDYEEYVYDAWKASGILGRITKKKRVFREPRKNTEVETILKEYKESIDATPGTANNGAVILAVVGGKISEGINFSDGLGRCIVMVGLPYPSPSDIELMERVKHIDRIGDPKKISNVTCFNGDAQAGFEVLRSCKHRGKEYYENLCMKAVNQSIGRAIRHINDYAAILLVDTRYTSDSSKKNISHPTNKLPHWIKNRLVSKTSSYGEVHRLLHQFFKFHKSKLV
ncbi:putative RNA helicase chromatin remodeling SNF2 family [Helianthus anomalus]